MFGVGVGEGVGEGDGVGDGVGVGDADGVGDGSAVGVAVGRMPKDAGFTATCSSFEQ